MPGLDFAVFPVWLNAAVFAAAAVIVWLAGTQLARCADAIAERTGLGHVFVGVVLLAGATELPELVTSVGAVLLGDAPLAVNNMFGGVVMQTAILALADACLGTNALTFVTPRPELILQGLLLVVLLAATLVAAAVGEVATVFGVGLSTIAILCIYVLGLWLLRRYADEDNWRPVDLPGSPLIPRRPGVAADEAAVPAVRSVVWRFVAASAVVLVAATGLVASAEALADQTGLGSSFMGATLLAACTSLPELSTTVAAVRLGAYGMAVANIFGSNALMVMLLFVSDVALRSGPILEAVDRSAMFGAAVGILVTAVFLVGLIERKDRTVFRMGIDSAVVLAIYAASLVGFYFLRSV